MIWKNDVKIISRICVMRMKKINTGKGTAVRMKRPKVRQREERDMLLDEKERTKEIGICAHACSIYLSG